MPASGVTVFDSSNREIVRLSESSPGGVEVKATPDGAFMPLSKSLFGRASSFSRQVFSISASPNTRGTIQQGMPNTSFPQVTYKPWTPNIRVTWGYLLNSTDFKTKSGTFRAESFTMVNGAKYQTADFGGGGKVLTGIRPMGVTGYYSGAPMFGFSPHRNILVEDLVIPVTIGTNITVTFKVEYELFDASTSIWVDGVDGFVLIDPIYPETN